MKEVQYRLNYLVNQYANKTASRQEEEELFSLIDESNHDDDIKNVMLRMLQKEAIDDVNKEQWDPVLRKVLGRFEMKDTDTAPVYQLAGRKKIINWKSIAAAAAVIIFICAGLVYFMPQGSDLHSVAMETPAQPADITPPNSSNAILTLSNGQIIILDSAGNGTLAQQGGVKVVKMADGQIAYNTQGHELKGEIMYNTLSNPAGSKVINITLEDGTKVWLNSESSLRYPTAFTGKERKVEITGEAYFEVAHISSTASKNNAMPFHVSMRKGVEVQVLGTHFNINSYDNEGSIKTTLLEGSVKVNKDGMSVVLKPGQQAQVNGSIKEPISVTTPNLDEVMAWKNGQFAYYNTDLETIMRQLARWYNVEVVYQDKIVDRYTVNVSRDVPVSQLFKFIEMSGGVHFNIENKKIMVKK